MNNTEYDVSYEEMCAAKKTLRAAFKHPSWCMRVKGGTPMIAFALQPIPNLVEEMEWIESTVSLEKFFREEMWLYEKELTDEARCKIADKLERFARMIRPLPNAQDQTRRENT